MHRLNQLISFNMKDLCEEGEMNYFRIMTDAKTEQFAEYCTSLYDLRNAFLECFTCRVMTDRE